MDDEWGLSMEEMDSLENNAKRQLAERQRSSSTASVPPPGPSHPGQNHHRAPAFSSPMKQPPHSPSKSFGRISKIPVKFFMDNPGRIGVQTTYNKVNSIKCVVSSLISKLDLQSNRAALRVDAWTIFFSSMM